MIETAKHKLFNFGLHQIKYSSHVLQSYFTLDENCCFFFKAIVLCFRLHFTKDNITNNTAAATVRQVVTVVFERMVAEDERHRGKVTKVVYF